jgi:hypothetical protein
MGDVNSLSYSCLLEWAPYRWVVFENTVGVASAAVQVIALFSPQPFMASSGPIILMLTSLAMLTVALVDLRYPSEEDGNAPDYHYLNLHSINNLELPHLHG